MKYREYPQDFLHEYVLGGAESKWVSTQIKNLFRP